MLIKDKAIFITKPAFKHLELFGIPAGLNNHWIIVKIGRKTFLVYNNTCLKTIKKGDNQEFRY